ncbi:MULTISPECIES: hypothetical protein [Acidobacterium]|uniref:DUF1018 domain-containing protein n=1 Tax=Acidobacterium capsulatum (strain ATCC 51196 / DSM 11244 / BCRC 80197 / JCM 7670 / NBRC 15755 / NCIMB 13165 / 161) TaxID=240015 RepID=C1F9Z3_ACIC5|nr:MULTISPECIES: hypothetical protein [Acidobacterium]ACO34437.1 hypothetical protein ACP_0369 [Acidobacterium capsulatum ATCC 51196]HCT62088.1 hypothetical protein [Acidobacterium sp.]
MSRQITSPQMKRLQVLFSQVARRTQIENTRDERLLWATEGIGRKVESFKDLTADEARRLIDAAQAQLNYRAPLKQRRSRADADRRGRDGRRDGKDLADQPQIASAQDIEQIEEMYQRLGWTRERFDAWLRSIRSPLKSRDRAIRTTADANKVRWALKGMLQAAGLWQDRRPA